MDFNEFLIGVAKAASEKKNQTKADNLLVGRGRANSHDTRGHNELVRDKFSGLRDNQMWDRFELWIMGNLHATLTYSAFMLRPESLNEMYCEAFGLDVVMEEHVESAKRHAEWMKQQVQLAEDERMGKTQ